MKWYWHLLFLIVSAVAACFAGNWLDQPLWQIVESRPVSFDKYDAVRKEWTTLVGDQERMNWWIETRAGRDPTVIRRLKLELPPLKSEYPYFGSSSVLGKILGDAVLCHEYFRSGGDNVKVELHYCVLDPATGKVLRRFTISNNSFGKIAGYGSKLAFAGSGFLHLFDVATKKERSLRVGDPACITFSPDGKLLACVDCSTKTFCLIDWEKAALLMPIQTETNAESFCFITNDTLLLSHDRGARDVKEVHSRWRWDGRLLKQASPGIRLLRYRILPDVKVTPGGELHLSVNQLKDWPLQFKPLLQWLTDKNLPVERWVPKQGYRHWLVLDDQDQIKREYYDGSTGRRQKLYDQLAVEVELDKQYASSTITFWNEHPVWPNALAVGVVLYLLLYLMERMLRHRPLARRAGI